MSQRYPKLRELPSGAVVLTISKQKLREAGLVDEDGRLKKQYLTDQEVDVEDGEIRAQLLDIEPAKLETPTAAD
jgi:hypothetical protein